MCPRNAYVKVLISKKMILRGGAFGKSLSHEILMNGIGAPGKKAPACLPFHHHVRTEREGSRGGGLLPESNHAGTLALDFQDPEL